jgi:enoyl-CoA hydratase/carnithine racemase
MERPGGIPQITFHTEGAALKRSGPSREQLGYAFADIARDQENSVVIMTGTGDAFCADIDLHGFGRFTPTCGTISTKMANIS